MKFKNLGGNHDENGVIYVKGDIIESDRDLDEMFTHKFQRVAEAPPEPKRKKLKVKKKSTAKPPQEPADKRGVDVTEEFDPGEGLKIFRRGSKFHVYEEDSTDPLNDKGLNKVDVESFVEDYLEE